MNWIRVNLFDTTWIRISGHDNALYQGAQPIRKLSDTEAISIIKDFLRVKEEKENENAGI
jgi:hypothetical protein